FRARGHTGSEAQASRGVAANAEGAQCHKKEEQSRQEPQPRRGVAPCRRGRTHRKSSSGTESKQGERNSSRYNRAADDCAPVDGGLRPSGIGWVNLTHLSAFRRTTGW